VLDGVNRLENDVALALAQHHAGSNSGFVLMPDALRDLSDKADLAVRRSRSIRLGNWLETTNAP